MWQNIIDSTLNALSNINDFASWLFVEIRLELDHPSNDIFDAMIGWLVDWVNGLGLSFTPFGIFSISTFTALFGIFIIKMIIS